MLFWKPWHFVKVFSIIIIKKEEQAKFAVKCE